MSNDDSLTADFFGTLTQGPAPVPEGRATRAELEQIVKELAGNHPFQAVFPWLDGQVVVVNAQRQIVCADESFPGSLGFDRPAMLYGKRMGEVIGCAHVHLGPDGCGSAQQCRFCGLLQSVLANLSGTPAVERDARIPVRTKSGIQIVRFDVRSVSVTWQGADLGVLLLRRPAAEGADAPTVDPRPSEGYPQALSRLTFIRKLGEGGMGNVYLVRDEDEHLHALKTILLSRAADPMVVQRFEREAEMSLQLKHPHIVETEEVGRTEDGVLYMVLEYCSQGTATDWLQRMGPLPTDLALYWLTSTAHALGYAWDTHSLVHRDIKPDNLLIDGVGQIKLADFGIARRMLPSEKRLTQDELAVGSVHYMAPEQFSQLTQMDVRSDMYALGATFYRLLCGFPPFDGEDPMMILARKTRETPVSIGNYRSSLPAALVECIDDLLQTDPDRRPRDPMTLAKRLMEITASEGVDLARIHNRYHLPELGSIEPD